MITISIDAKFIEHHYWHTLTNSFTTLVVFFEALMNQFTSIQVIDPIFTHSSSVFAPLSTLESFMPTSLPLHLKFPPTPSPFIHMIFPPFHFHQHLPIFQNLHQQLNWSTFVVQCIYISPTIGCWNMLFIWNSLMTSSHVWLPWMNHFSIKM
jgi:hypothetical protein